MNHLTEIPRLNNTYFGMRHGESTANVDGLIISDPKTGLDNYGLTEIGKKQVVESVEKHPELNRYAKIYCSDFKRAKETANIAQETLNASEVIIATELRERYFGELEGAHHKNYEKVFEHDVKDHEHTMYNVEPVSQVIERTTGLIQLLENTYTEETILLVSHGDPLHILFACFTGIHPTERFKFLNFKNAEIRRMHNDPFA